MTRYLAATRAGLMLAAAMLAAPALAQEDAAEAPPEAAPPADAPLAERIQYWADADRDGDPAAALAALMALQTEVEADPSAVSARQRGELLAMIGVAHYAQQQMDDAALWFDRAEAAYAEDGNAPDKVAEMAINRAVLMRRANRLGEAEEAARLALAIRQDLYDEPHEEVASALGTLGNVLYSSGRYEESLDLMRQALDEQRAAGPDDAFEIIKRLDSLASLLDETGRDTEALRVARESEALARAHLGRDHAWYGYVLNTLGQVLLDLTLYGEAIPVIRETLDVRRQQLGPEHPYTAASQMVLAVALEETGHLREASALSGAATEILEQHRDLMDPNTLAGFLRTRARLAASLGEWDLYAQRIADAEPVLAEMLDSQNPALAIFHIDHAYQLYRRGETDAARELAERWVPILAQKLIPANNDRVFGELLLARLRQLDGDAASQGDALWQTVDPVAAQLVAKLSDVRAADRDIARQASANSAAMLLYLETALDAGDEDRAFGAVQILTLSELALTQGRATDERGGGESEAFALHRQLVDTNRRLRLVERRIALELSADSEEGAAEALDAQRAQLDALAGELLATLVADHPDFIARIRPQPISLERLRQSLGEGELVTIPVETTFGSWVVQVDGRGMVWTSVDGESLRANVAALRDAVAPDSDLGAFPAEAAHALFKQLFPSGLGDHRQVFLYGGQSLASLPLAMLLTGEARGDLAGAPWLVRDAASQVIGNLAVFAAGRAQGPLRAGDISTFAGIGGAELPGEAGGEVQLAGLFRSGRPAADSIADLPPLVTADAELQALADALPGDDVLLVGSDAAEENFKRADLSGARVIAFATHGLVAGELRNLWEPALLLGTLDKDSGEDGLLGASEIARLKLDADWVILSACNTAAGADGGAPVYSGLATAFAQAGARSLMLSHWRVRDDVASVLSVETVRGAASGLSRAEALRQAQLALMSRPDIADAAHPAIWAPFVILEN
ncbi:CHAT domain-containing tetratricopeptide repeat protein [Aurantiacibacter zhengii]|uniref:CHAT domain-containing protein n=1 Tax=Aurantiacibacter zhengii TaxID=2307003 RepID=A0A418NP81_9SPHN|nr:CHAT domain-containing tetratricopeptide repeat protein [Aurantiacibacter zhengii]RIV83907.1 CHAT domain-containing protein [Aurantiacibacter zhengii]